MSSRRSGRSRRRWCRSGPEGYTIDVLSFEPGDTLLLYTDGVIEARDASGVGTVGCASGWRLRWMVPAEPSALSAGLLGWPGWTVVRTRSTARGGA
ncbi:SpoIIE family protein phosphatase [Streptomyces mirabilis]|uniref:SpoIIE family protein phosphatase n=1 Tax=Streptomyces mirabilis TaxID=68239 RepID=UPI003F4DCEA6